MLIRTLITASLLYNTYYPVNIANTRIGVNRGSLIQYANCEWYNNKCINNIETQFPNLNKYNHITINEINLNANLLFRQLVKCNLTYYVSKNKHHLIAYDNLNDRYEIVSTPLTHNRTRLFIFSNKKDNPLLI